MSMVIRQCIQCSRPFDFLASPSRLEAGWGKFCSKSCNSKYNYSEPWKRLIGKKSWNNNQQLINCSVCKKDFTLPLSRIKNGARFCSRKCNGINRATQYSGENNHQWKGDKASYRSLHHWVEQHRGKPQECEECGIAGDRGKKRNYHWANISGKYHRDLKDWKRMCVPCHKRYDLNRKELYAA